MRRKVIQETEIDLCPFCGGVWLDGGEFERISGVDPSDYRQLKCALCGSPMLTRTIHGIEIDICTKCGGVWLDNGELDKIVGLNPFGDFGQNEFQMFRDAILISREFERAKRKKDAQRAATPTIVNDVFLIYQDGCLIVHKTRRLKPDMDDDVLSAMFIAIQTFIEDSFKDERETELKKLAFGESEILIERGEFIYLAVVVSGEIPDDFSQRLRRTVHAVEERYGEVLEDWDHRYDRLREAQDVIAEYLLFD